MTPDLTKKRIQELVPEVMELKFGGELITNAYSFEGTREVVTYSLLNFSEPLNEIGLAFRIKPIVQESIVEILGSPITLAVVLCSIEKSSYDKKGNKDRSGSRKETWLVSASGEFVSNDETLPYECGHCGSGIYWDLAKDYDDQSEETKKFIGKLIGAI